MENSIQYGNDPIVDISGELQISRRGKLQFTLQLPQSETTRFQAAYTSISGMNFADEATAGLFLEKVIEQLTI